MEQVERKITGVYIRFMGCKAPKRKPSSQLVEVDILDGHVTLSPDALIDLERKAYACLDGYKLANGSATLLCIFGKEDKEMRFMGIVPNQAQILLRSK